MGLSGKIKAGIEIVGSIADAVKSARMNGKEYYEDVFFSAGSSYYTKDIQKVMKPNLEYLSLPGAIVKNGHAGRKIFQYNCADKSAKLIPDPKNAHDKNAIMIKVDGHLVGYIKREECPHVKSILENGHIEYINVFISGGKYKIVSANKNIQNFEIGYTVRVTVGYFK